MKFLFIPICVFLFITCTPQRRMHRLITRHPELLFPDTVHFRRDILIPERTARLSMPADRFCEDFFTGREVTVSDASTGLTVRLARTPPEGATPDSIVIRVTSPPDTLKIDEKIPVQTVTVQAYPASRELLKKTVPLWILLVVAVILILKRFLTR